MTPREDLLDRIETYADAKTSGSDRLMKLATRHLAELLQRVDIVAPIEAPPEVKKVVEATLHPATRKRPAKRQAET